MRAFKFRNPSTPLFPDNIKFGESKAFLGIEDAMEGNWDDVPKPIELNRKVLGKHNHRVVTTTLNAVVYDRFKVVVETETIQTESPEFIDLDHCYTYMRGLRVRGLMIPGLDLFGNEQSIAPHDIKSVILMTLEEDSWIPVVEGFTSPRISSIKSEAIPYSQVVPDYLFPKPQP